MELRCPVLDDGRLPVRHARDGENISPPLSWRGVPRDTRELVVLLDGITPSTKPPWPHWLLYGIDPGRDGLPEGFRHAAEPESPAPAVQGCNGLGNVGYDGPLGTAGREVKLRFTLIAVDRPLDLDAGATRDELLRAVDGHELDRAELVVAYERPRPVG